MSNHATVIDRSVEDANAWLAELAAEYQCDREEALRVLRTVLHAVRDRVNVDEAAQLAAQLPTLIRGIYYTDWDPSRTPAPGGARALLDRVAREARLSGDAEAAFAVRAVTRTLARHVSPGELDDVFAQLPQELLDVLADESRR